MGVGASDTGGQGADERRERERRQAESRRQREERERQERLESLGLGGQARQDTLERLMQSQGLARNQSVVDALQTMGFFGTDPTGQDLLTAQDLSRAVAGAGGNQQQALLDLGLTQQQVGELAQLGASDPEMFGPGGPMPVDLQNIPQIPGVAANLFSDERLARFLIEEAVGQRGLGPDVLAEGGAGLPEDLQELFGFLGTQDVNQLTEALTGTAEREQERAERVGGFRRDIFGQGVEQDIMNEIMGLTGLEDVGFLSPFIQEQIGLNLQDVPITEENLGTFIDPDLAETVIAGEEDRRINQMLRDIEGFAPAGFELDAFGPTADDAILEEILGERFGTAESTLQRAIDRGALLGEGVTAAQEELAGAREQAMSQLQGIGSGVLATNRMSLRDLAEQARQNVGNFRLGSGFTLDPFRRNVQQETAERQQRLGGDIRSAVAPGSLFDVEGILSRGQAAQGTLNVGRSRQDILGALAQRGGERRQRRGFGDRPGVF